MTIAESLMQAVEDRLGGSPALVDNLRRAHRIPVSIENAPAIYLIDGKDEPLGKESDCQRERRKYFEVDVIVRDDAGASAADTLIDGVNDRLNPATAYGDGVTLHQGPIEPDTESADQDATRVTMEFWFEYYAPDGWSL